MEYDASPVARCCQKSGVDRGAAQFKNLKLSYEHVADGLRLDLDLHLPQALVLTRLAFVLQHDIQGGQTGGCVSDATSFNEAGRKHQPVEASGRSWPGQAGCS